MDFYDLMVVWRRRFKLSLGVGFVGVRFGLVQPSGPNKPTFNISTLKTAQLFKACFDYETSFPELIFSERLFTKAAWFVSAVKYKTVSDS